MAPAASGEAGPGFVNIWAGAAFYAFVLEMFPFAAVLMLLSVSGNDCNVPITASDAVKPTGKFGIMGVAEINVPVGHEAGLQCCPSGICQIGASLTTMGMLVVPVMLKPN